MIILRAWDVVWVDFDPVVGHEQAGKRPAIVVSTGMHLRYAQTLVTVMPVTTRFRPLPHRIEITSLKKTSYAMTEQVRTISRERISGSEPYGRLSESEIEQVRYALGRMIQVRKQS